MELPDLKRNNFTNHLESLFVHKKFTWPDFGGI